MIDCRIVRQFRAAPIDCIIVVALMAWCITAKSLTDSLVLMVLAKQFINDVARAESASAEENHK